MIDKKKVNEKGFTLLELVIAVGVLLILTVFGLVGYNSITRNSKQAAVNKAVDEVYTKSINYQLDGKPSTTPLTAMDEYNKSNETSSKKQVVVIVNELDSNGRIRVTATYGEGEASATKETPVKSEHNDSEIDTGLPEVEGPVDNKRVTRMTYLCEDSTKTGYVGALNILPGTEVYLKEKGQKDSEAKIIGYGSRSSDPNFHMREDVENGMKEVSGNSNAGIYNRSNAMTMEKGITYQVIVYGQFEVLSSPGRDDPNAGEGQSLADCLRSVDEFGEDIGLKYITYFGEANLRSMPKELPPTVISLYGAFGRSNNFNDPNISNWDTSNVRNMRSMFWGSENFNQPLNWNTDNVETTLWMFWEAKSFNQDLSTRTDPVTGETYWNVSNISNMGQMFSGTESFNNGCAPEETTCPMNWDLSHQKDTKRIFQNALGFRQEY